MRPISVVAAGAVSAFGRGEAAVTLGRVGDPPPVAVRDDREFRALRLRSLAGRVALIPVDEPDRAGALLSLAVDELVGELDQRLPGWRGRRLALVVGTSAGGMPTLERVLAERAAGRPLDAEMSRAALYGGPLSVLARALGDGVPTISVLAACASSAFAIGLGCRWLEAGWAELVIAGGYDALSALVANGFESLGAITASGARPFRRERDGMVLGEGAGLVALAAGAPGPSALGVVLGFSATSDAFHVTAPDPEGRGLARAARAALADAGADASEIDFVSAHATCTPHNDAAEAAALAALFPADTREPNVFAYKAAIGHTLGAAGALESLAALRALRERSVPASAGEGTFEPNLRARILARNAAGPLGRCLKLSAAFGGANAALVLGSPNERRAGPRREPRPVHLLARGEPVLAPDERLLAERTVLAELQRARLDGASALAVTASALLLDGRRVFDAERTAVVVGTSAAALEADELFDVRRRERGVRSVEPRRFPATSPNLPAGQCSIAFGLRGPTLAIGGGPAGALEALLVAHDLVAMGDADDALVIACDDAGRLVRELFEAAHLPVPRHGALAVAIGRDAAQSLGVLDRDALAAAATPRAIDGETGWPALLRTLDTIVRRAPE